MAKKLPPQVFGKVSCDELLTKRILVQNGNSVLIVARADKDSQAEFNFIGRAEGEYVNLLAINMAPDGTPLIRMINPATGNLEKVDQTTIQFLPVDTEPEEIVESDET